jgi:hypothetical protein
MRSFQFSPRHPVQGVGILPGGECFLTAQPYVGVAVRELHTGNTLCQIDLGRNSEIERLHLSPWYDACMVNDYWILQLESENPIRMHYPILLFTGVGFTETELRTVRWEFSQETDGFIASVLVYPWPCQDGTPPIRRLGFNVPRLRNMKQYLTSTGEFVLIVGQKGLPGLYATSTFEMITELHTRLRMHHARGNSTRVVSNCTGEYLGIFVEDQLEIFSLRPLLDHPEPRKSRLLSPIQIVGFSEEDRATMPDIPAFVITPNGQSTLMIGDRNRIIMIDHETGLIAKKWHWRVEAPVSLGVAPDGSMAILGARQGKVVIWDLD